MIHSPFKIICLTAALSGLLIGCDGPSDRPTDKGQLPVVAGVPPLAFLIEQIGGQHVRVETLVQSNQDPHTFEPTPQQVLALSRSAVFFKIGMPFENRVVERVRQANPKLKVVDIGEGVKKLSDCCAAHDEKHQGEHSHETAPHHADHDHHAAPHDHHRSESDTEFDPHIWLSPPLLKIQATNIARALAEVDVAHAADYRNNLEQFLRRLDQLHERLAKVFAPYRGRSFVVFHPGFAYFADSYGLKEEAVEAGGRQPTPNQLRALIEKAKAEGIKTIFVQPQYDPHSVDVLAEAIGAKVVPMNGLARDVMNDIEDIANKVEAALGESKPAPQR